MANLPTMSESNVSRKSSLEKVLPVMAKDISVMKTSLIKFMQSQTNQRSKAEAYFQKAKQKENLYESRKAAAIKSSTSPTKSGGSSTGLFDSNVGFFDFLKKIFNILTKGLLVGGAVFGIKKLLEDPEIRQNLGNFLKDIFVGILGLVRDGANLFAETLQKNGPEIQKALTETFVAIMGAIESAINGLTDLLTGPNSKEIYDSIGRVFTAIGNAIVKVFTTKIDIKGIEVPLGLVIAGLAALPAILSGFGLALRNATAAALGFGVSGGKGAAGAIGGIMSMITGGIRAAIAAALLAYAGSEAYNAWKKKNPDKDSEGNAIDPKSQLNDRTFPGAYDQQTGSLDSGKLAVGAAEVTGAVIAGQAGYKMIKAGSAMRGGPSVPVTPGAPTPSTGFPRGSAPTVTPSAQLPTTQSNIIQQSAGSGARDYERSRAMNNAAEGPMSGKRGPLPPKETSMLEKVTTFIKKIYGKGASVVTRFVAFMGPKIAARFGWMLAIKATGAMASIGAGGALIATGIGAAAGAALTAAGWALVAVDVYFLFSLIQDFMKSEGLSETSPTQAVTDPVGDASFRQQMTQGASRSREESIDVGDARGMAEQYLGRKMSDVEWNELVRATYAEGSGKSTEEYAAIMASILNRSRKKGGKNISDILRESGQFEAVTGGKNPRWKSGTVAAKDYDMITSGTSILGALSHDLDSFGASDLKAYQNEATGRKHLANLMNSGGMQLGGSTFGYGLYGGGKPSANPSASLRLDSNQVNAAERNRKDAEDARNNASNVNIVGSFNENKQDTKPASGTTPPVSSPFNEEMFFREQMKSMLFQ